MDVALAHWDSYELLFRRASGEDRPLRNTVLPELREGHVHGLIFVVGGDSLEHSAGSEDRLVGSLLVQSALQEEVAACKDEVRIVRTKCDLSDAVDQGKVWLLQGIEGAGPLKGRLEVLHSFYRLGLRLVGITWNGRNDAADGVGVRSPSGLTAFGRELVLEMNRLGMLIDVAHLAPRGLSEVLEVSRQPVIASHSNAWSVAQHPRNLTDDQLRELAAAGGYVGVNFLPSFLVDDPTSVDGGLEVRHIVDHVDHIAGIVGIDKVVLGGDLTYDPWRAAVGRRRSYQGVDVGTGMSVRSPVHVFPEMVPLIKALESAGLSDTQLMGVLSKNLERLLGDILPERNE